MSTPSAGADEGQHGTAQSLGTADLAVVLHLIESFGNEAYRGLRVERRKSRQVDSQRRAAWA